MWSFRFVCISLNIHNSQTCTCDMVQCCCVNIVQWPCHRLLSPAQSAVQNSQVQLARCFCSHFHLSTPPLLFDGYKGTKKIIPIYLNLCLYYSSTLLTSLALSLWSHKHHPEYEGEKAKRLPCLYGIKHIDLNISFRGKSWNTDLCIAKVLCLQVNVKNPCHPNTKTEHIQTFINI